MSGRAEAFAPVRREPAGGAPGRVRSAEPHLPGRRCRPLRRLSIRILRTFRLNNLLVQKAVVEIARRLPKGKALRILEIGGGTGGTTSFVLPVLPEHCTEYVFTDISPRFTAHAQHRFARYPFAQFRTLDIEHDPLEQGFDAHSFDLIIASDVLHATKDLRRTLDHIKQLLGSGGTVAIVELTRPWLFLTLIFGLLKGWWLFDDDVRSGRALHLTGRLEEPAA